MIIKRKLANHKTLPSFSKKALTKLETKGEKLGFELTMIGLMALIETKVRTANCDALHRLGVGEPRIPAYVVLLKYFSKRSSVKFPHSHTLHLFTSCALNACTRQQGLCCVTHEGWILIGQFYYFKSTPLTGKAHIQCSPLELLALRHYPYIYDIFRLK